MEAIFLALKSALESGSIFSTIGAVFLCYVGGILSSFTPCIYPMIPITVGFIGGASERSVKEGWILSSFYVFGMSLVYTILGIFASITGKIFGSFTNTPAWYLGLGIVMTISALWMMDVIEFDPQVMLAKLTKKKVHHHGHDAESTKFGAFILGASSGFIAAPCTTPVLTTILSFIATQGSVVLGAMLMFSFAMGLGTILVVIGTFTGAVKVMPKSGQWMKTIKILSGAMILIIAEYFIYKAGTFK